MLPRERAEKILTLHAAGWPARAIADHVGHSLPTVYGYINGRRTPGVRAPQPSLLTEPLASYCRQRLAEDPHLRTSVLFKEVADLGFQGSRATFYRELDRRLLVLADRRRTNSQEEPEVPSGMSRTLARRPERTPVLPQRVAAVAGETLNSYLARIAQANYLTVSEVLAVLPTWFSTKTNNLDDRAQHHMLAPAATHALHELAHLTGTTPAGLAHALPAFGTDESPIRATTACHRCTARLGIREPVPVHLPIHHKVCTRHGIWLSDLGEPHLDLSICPEITAAQHRANRLLRRFTPQQLTLAHQTAVKAVPPWPASPAAVPHHWRYRLLALQTHNHHRGIPTELDTYTHAAIYPDAIELAAAALARHPHDPARSTGEISPHLRTVAPVGHGHFATQDSSSQVRATASGTTP
ncbi:TniQ family protein [Streptomyces sp. CT34]|uniref:TniQ family protein n=1 Tax=Streptomyces sp. CT34 TaxID=1553907 RepID=UPI0006917E9F|nr:TniQ family protein [Streptomyces sp. CT34]